MDRYIEIKKRLLSVAQENEAIKAIVFIGSSVRDYSRADEYSDLDVIIVTDEPDYILYGSFPEKLGKPEISFVEPTLGGGFERRILFDGCLDVDLLAFTQEQFEYAVIQCIAAEVMNRGYFVFYDIIDLQSLLNKHITCTEQKRHIMSESEFVNKVNDFWFHTVWASKKILRGELWCAKMCVDAYLKNIMLGIIELGVSSDIDVWHNGRFLEKWAGSETVDALGSCFAHYEKDDIVSALLVSARLFCKAARTASDLHRYSYPERAEEYALSQLAIFFDAQ